MDNGACWRCRWFEPDKDAENEDVGWCNRYPPQMVVSDGNIPTTSWFPSTTCIEYCGEFEEAGEMSDVATVKVELSDEQMDVLLRDIGDLIGKVDALEKRIEKMERKLNHKGGDE